jgi:hypothetical protein
MARTMGEGDRQPADAVRHKIVPEVGARDLQHDHPPKNDPQALRIPDGGCRAWPVNPR